MLISIPINSIIKEMKIAYLIRNQTHRIGCAGVTGGWGWRQWRSVGLLGLHWTTLGHWEEKSALPAVGANDWEPCCSGASPTLCLDEWPPPGLARGCELSPEWHSGSSDCTFWNFPKKRTKKKYGKRRKTVIGNLESFLIGKVTICLQKNYRDQNGVIRGRYGFIAQNSPVLNVSILLVVIDDKSWIKQIWVCCICIWRVYMTFMGFASETFY